MTDEAQNIEGLLGIQGKEGTLVIGAASQENALQEKKTELSKKLRGFDLAISESVNVFLETIETIEGTAALYISHVANKTESMLPTWLGPYCSFQKGYSPVDLEDVKKSGPVPDTGIITSYGDFIVENNVGAQFPSTLPISENIVPNGESLILSLMVAKAVTTQATIDLAMLKKSVFESSLGCWALHTPWQGLISAVMVDGAGTSITGLRSTSALTNDPCLRYSSNPNEVGDYSGYGWGSGVGKGWTDHPDIIKEHYEDVVLPTGSDVLIIDRVTGVQAAYKIDSTVIDNTNLTITFAALPNPGTMVNVFGRDVSLDPPGTLAYMVVVDIAGAGCIDSTYGFTAFLAWNCFEKQDANTWRVFDTTHIQQTTLRQEDFDGTGLFINSYQIHDGTETIQARDLFYHINIDEALLKDPSFYTIDQLQGIYAGMAKDLAQVGGWAQQWASNEAAIVSSGERKQTFHNEDSLNGQSKPVKPVGNYLNLLRSSIEGVSLTLPVDTMQEGVIESGLGLTLVTGAMYKVNDA
jgi:hypothetical protein